MKIFAYGTLRHEESNWYGLLKGRSSLVGTYNVPGFAMVTNGHFPLGYKQADSTIVADLFEVDAGKEKEVLKDLDRLEGYPHFYNREEVEIHPKGSAWIYFITSQTTLQGLTPISSGDWIEFLEAPEEVA